MGVSANGAAKKKRVGEFGAMDKAAGVVSGIIAAEIIPCTLEFLDRTTIHCVEDYAKIGLPLDCEALLLIETDGHPVVVAVEAAQIEKICQDKGRVGLRIGQDEVEAPKLFTARRSPFFALARVFPTPTLEDRPVPPFPM